MTEIRCLMQSITGIGILFQSYGFIFCSFCKSIFFTFYMACIDIFMLPLKFSRTRLAEDTYSRTFLSIADGRGKSIALFRSLLLLIFSKLALNKRFYELIVYLREIPDSSNFSCKAP